MKDLLDLRNKIKNKKPSFLRQDAHRIKKLKKKWRRPSGRHSKMRLNLRGYRKQVSVGYGSPKKVKFLNKDGLKEIVVNNLRDLETVKEGVVCIGSKVGLKKKIELLNKIKELKLKVVNIKDVDGFIKNVKEKLDAKSSAKKKKLEAKTKKKKAAIKKAEEKKKKAEEKEDKEDKKEKTKVLEKKRTGREGDLI